MHLLDRLFELMTALETPDVQKEIIRGHVNDKTDFSAMDDGVFSNEIDHCLSVGASDTAGISGVGHS